VLVYKSRTRVIRMFDQALCPLSNIPHCCLPAGVCPARNRDSLSGSLHPRQVLLLLPICQWDMLIFSLINLNYMLMLSSIHAYEGDPAFLEDLPERCRLHNVTHLCAPVLVLLLWSWKKPMVIPS
jgi:hypothetical protein